jgi:hypothetical protein
MVAKIPDDVRTRANVETLEQQLRQYVSENPEREKDSTGIKLKRQLLEKYYELPKYIPPRAGTYTAVSRQSSQRLAGLNRFDGQLFWEVPARYSFRHNTIASGNGKVFAVDRLDDALQQHLKRRGEKERRSPQQFSVGWIHKLSGFVIMSFALRKAIRPAAN